MIEDRLASTEEEERFPKELLEKPPAERRAYFRAYTVGHPVLRDAYTKAMRILRQQGGKQIVLVVGPGRSGKTFLSEWLAEELRAEWVPLQASDPGRIPVISVEIPGRDTLRPSWALIYELVLKALEEPLIEKKISYDDVTLYPAGDGRLVIKERLAAGKLGLAVVRALEYRRPVLFFDEFHHLLAWPGWSYQDHMDCSKSLANRGKTKLGLYATYEALDLLDFSDQVTCRTKIIHLRRYGKGDKDQADFDGVIYSFQINMPFPHEPDLGKHFDYLYERTNGRVGLLAIWLQEAYDLVLEEGAGTMKPKHLKMTEPLTKRQAQKMESALIESENRYYESVGEEEEVGDEEEDGISDAAEAPSRSDESHGEAKGPATRRRPRRVGARKPERDPTGRDKIAA